MRTNIDIDDDLMAAAMQGGQYKSKREAVEDGLRLIARRNHAREVLRWEGKLHWDDQPDPDMLNTDPATLHSGVMMEPAAPYPAPATKDGHGHDRR